MKVVALGRTRMLYDSIIFLHNKGIEIPLIITSKAQSEYDITEGDFEKLAESIGTEFINNVKINEAETVEKLKKINADMAISVNWQNIISEEVIQCFPNGILNCHIGDLPKYRGNAVINWAIINGEEEVVITIHKMDKGLDTGDIVLKEKVRINGLNIGKVMKICNSKIPQMFYKSVHGLLSGKIIPAKQESEIGKSLRCYPRIPLDSFIDWNNTAEKINTLIRASSEPFIGAYTYFNTKKLYILRSHVEKNIQPSLFVPGQVLWRRTQTGEVGIATGKDVLVIEKVKYDNLENILPTEVIISLRSRLGMYVEEEIYLLLQKVKKLEDMVYDIYTNK